MAHYYFDTSALVKEYHFEAGSEWVQSVLHEMSGEKPAHAIYLAELAIAECAAAFAILARMNQIGIEQRDAVYARFREDIITRYQSVHVTREIINTAAHLTQHYPLRGYDAVHLATALALREHLTRFGMNLTFVTSDSQLGTAAQGEGFQVANPLLQSNR